MYWENGETPGFDRSWFVIQPEARLLCGICLDVLNDPYKCVNNHACCKLCLERWISAGRRECPFCRAYIQVRNMVRDDVRRLEVDALLVTCCSCIRNETISNKCCTWTGTLKEYFMRVNLCVFNRSNKEHLAHHLQLVAPQTRSYVLQNAIKLAITKNWGFLVYT